MKRIVADVRTGPQTVAILLSRSGDRSNLSLAIRFLSRLWGGRYGQLLPVDGSVPDDATLRQLALSRPDFVYGADIDFAIWEPCIRESCQPRGIGPLRKEFVNSINVGIEDFATDRDLIRYVRESDARASSTRVRKNFFVTISRQNPLAEYRDAVFGDSPSHVHQDFLQHSETKLGPEATFEDILELHTGIAQRAGRTWLDVANHGLSVAVNGLFGVPTLIVVSDALLDLSFYWNLRMTSDTGWPVPVFPIPEDELSNPNLPSALAAWLEVVQRFTPRSDFLRVVSSSAKANVLKTFTDRLMDALQETAIRTIDVVASHPGGIVATPYESELQLQIDVVGRNWRLHPPVPTIFQGGRTRSFVVEFLRDSTSRRAIAELKVPPRQSSLAVLNAPGPIRFTEWRFVPVSLGVHGLRLRCTDAKAISLYRPTSCEILEECLRASGLVPVKDEKRHAYVPLLRRFGGLERAADAMTGDYRKVLRWLVKRSGTIGEMKSSQIGRNGKLANDSEQAGNPEILRHLDEETQRLVRQRLRRRRLGVSPDSSEVGALLELWADMRIVRRYWNMPRCPQCGKQKSEQTLRLNRPVRCYSCGSRIRLPESIKIGYRLDRVVRNGIREGVLPVVLTARFLRLLTSKGFLWLPGVKFQDGTQRSDLDIVASCDGHLFVAECKDLGDVEPQAIQWDELVSQFIQTIKVAEKVRASTVVFATLLPVVPEHVVQRFREVVPESLGILVLDGNDLEKGYREVSAGNNLELKRYLSVYDCVPRKEYGTTASFK